MSELKVNKVSPQSGTDFTLGDSGDTFTVPSGATLTVAGTFTQTGAQTFDGGVDIDNFNINGTTITLSSGDMTLDVAGDIVLDADGGDVFVKDAGTTFGSLTNTSGNLIIKSGTTTAATFSGANVTLAGTVGSGAITSTGIVTGTAFTAGNAVLAEAELELLDGLTAGTAIASKVVTTDANIDTTGQRNLTITGELDAATGDFSGAVDVAGALTSSATATITVADNSDVLILKSTDADANVGPILSLHRDSANPADNDITGRINFRADNDAGEAIDYASMFCKLADVTDGTEDFKLIIQGKKAGTDVNILQIGEDEVIINEDSNDVDFRVETNGRSHMIEANAGNDTVNFYAAEDSEMNIQNVQNHSSGMIWGWGQTDSNHVGARIQESTSSNNATVDAFRFFKRDGSSLYKAGYMAGILMVSCPFSANQFNAVYALETCGNSGGDLTLIDAMTRGTSPVSAVNIVADGGSGAVKVQIVYINNSGVVGTRKAYVSFMGQ